MLEPLVRFPSARLLLGGPASAGSALNSICSSTWGHAQGQYERHLLCVDKQKEEEEEGKEEQEEVVALPCGLTLIIRPMALRHLHAHPLLRHALPANTHDLRYFDQ